MKAQVPSFRMSPAHRHVFNSFRVYFDIIGVTFVRFFLPFVHSSTFITVLSVYNVLAWVTILRLENSRIPEFTTTRIKQRDAWVYTLKLLPFLILLFLNLFFILHVHPSFKMPTLSAFIVGLLIPTYMDELLFRNVLQVKLRKLGLPVIVAVIVQSILYSVSFAITHQSWMVVILSFVFGIVNGWIVYKFRTLWTVFALSFLWRFLFL